MEEKSKKLSGRLVIKHAGGLNAAFGELNKEFKRLHPDVELVDEMGGSVDLVREVVNGKECGVLGSADYSLIPRLMFPAHAEWYIIFASIQMTLRYSAESKYADQVNETNWYEILQRDGVTLWHPDANGDPGGYRALMVLQLAEKYYKIPGFYGRIMASHSCVFNRSNFQESRSGYGFSYGMHAPPQSGMKFIRLPEEIDLSNSKFKDFYRQAEIKIAGDAPGESMVLQGEPIYFGLTIPRNLVNQEIAVAWVCLLLSDTGMNIIKQAGMVPVKPVLTSDPGKIPQMFKSYLS
jgi:molybdate/tungstate transport system substrate-binding protein